jgi:hypothetical protein
VLEEQAVGREGPLLGRFVIIAVGENKHADALWPLLHREIDAAEVLAALRRRSRGCVSVANTNILAVEGP